MLCDTYRAKTVSDSFHTKNFLYGLKRTMRVLKNTVGNNEDTKDDMGFIEKVEIVPIKHKKLFVMELLILVVCLAINVICVCVTKFVLHSGVT